LVKPGGRLVYATCSLLAEEDEAIADAFNHSVGSEFMPLPVAELLAQAKVEQAETLVDGTYLRLWPQLHGCDGFFAAVWQRR